MLGSRHDTSHQTTASRKVAVAVEEYWQHKPGDRVMTVDGYLGTVEAVADGPFPGTEAYRVSLDNDLGGGDYASGQLREANERRGSFDVEALGTAVSDYPELGTILRDRPDPARYPDSTLSMFASKQANQEWTGEMPEQFRQNKDHAREWLIGHNQGAQHSGEPVADYDQNDPFSHGYATGHAYQQRVDADPDHPDAECKHPWCEDQPYHTNAEHIDPPDRDPNSDESRDAERSIRDAFSGGEHEDASWLLGQQPTGPTKYSQRQVADPYEMFRQAAMDSDFAFQVTAAWADVRRKANRIRKSGGVEITIAKSGYVEGAVQGDHNRYETQLMSVPGTKRVGNWGCGCKWGAYHWGAPDDHSKFAGRMCSHALALHLEVQSRGMFGRDVKPDSDPNWLGGGPVVRRYDIDSDTNVMASRQDSPLLVMAKHLVASGESAEEVQVLFDTVASVNSPFGEPSPPEADYGPGPTKPREEENPAQMGWASTPEPQNWDAQNPQDLGDRMAVLNELTKQGFLPLLLRAAPMLMRAAPAAEEAGAAGAAAPKMPGMIPGVADAASLLGGSKGDDDDDEGGQKQRAGNPGQGATNEQDAMRQSIKPFGTLHDSPEAALPTTDGDIDTGDTAWRASGDSGGGLGPGPSIKGDPTSLEPEDQTFVSTGSVNDIVEQFQRTAGAQSLQAGSSDVADIAQAAQEHLAKTAMDSFSPSEQQELINENPSGRAQNFDRLEITGTHYENIADDDDDEEGWMA